MRVHRVLIRNLVQGNLTVSGAGAEHLARVLRVKPGQQVQAFDGDGLEANGVVTAVEPGRVSLDLSEPAPATVEASLAITCCVALLKGDKLSDVIRMGTELGVVEFRLFVGRHSDVRELSERKLIRLRRVAAEAAKQSGRAVVPEVHGAVQLNVLLSELEGPCLHADPRASSTVAGSVADGAGAVNILTGPEGGFSDSEIAQLAEAGSTGVRLGARILRAETAPVALAAALLLPEAL